jgi:hypothetical protein
MFVSKQRRGRGVNGVALGVSAYRRIHLRQGYGGQVGVCARVLKSYSVLVVVAHQNVIEPSLISAEA